MRSELGSQDTSTSDGGRRGRPWIVAVAAAAAVAALVVVNVRREPTAVRRPDGGSPPPFYWETGDRPRALVDLDEIRSGGPPPDGIPPIDEPRFVSAAEATWLKGREPVMLLVHRDEARAYPLQIMTWHEIANDEIAGDPVTVTFCPLCNSAVAFRRTVEGEVLDFGTSGRLYRSNLVMYDRLTRSLWIQFTGQAVVGRYIGTELETLPVQIASWTEVRAAYPRVRVLSRETGFERSYGTNPYAGYDDVDSTPFLFDGETDDRMRPMERVVTVLRGDEAVAYPLESLQKRDGVVHDGDIVVLLASGTASALDTSAIAEGRDVGTAGVFSRKVGERTLTFEPSGGGFRDTETGTTWNALGRGLVGPLQGAQLEPIVHDDTFWFVWAAFRPQTRIVR